MKKIGLFFGGLGNESEISILSAKNIADNFDYNKYRLVLVYWQKDGKFFILKNLNERKKLSANKLLEISEFKKFFDIALLMTHGKYGEDGVLQAILESQKIKYCGCRVLSSALCMDKAIFKKLMQSQNIPQVRFEAIDYGTEGKGVIAKKLKSIRRRFSLPIFVKPANSGSSIGIVKVKNFNDINGAIKEALKHDSKIVFEQGINNPTEVEVAVLGNKDITISRPGQLVPANEFYDYNDKYLLNKTKIIIPAKLSKNTREKIRKIAMEAYRLCDCKGFARIDFLISGNRVHLSEINTLPGFTKNSMYPRLMIDNGISYKNLINKIIELAK